MMVLKDNKVFRNLPTILFCLVLLCLCTGPVPASATGPHSRKIIVTPPPRHGKHVVTISPAHKTIWVGNVKYYFHDGTYYLKKAGGYVSVAAPRGAVILSIPKGCRSARVGGSLYFFWSGACYKKTPRGYIVVEAPEPSVIVQEPLYVAKKERYRTKKAYVDVQTLNVRSGPGKTHPVTFRVYKGDLLRIRGKENKWLYVKLPSGNFGWVLGKYTRHTPPARG